MKAWVEHYSRLLNVEFEWPCDLLPMVAPVEGPVPPITLDMISKALSKMRCDKAAGPSGIIAEMLKAAGKEGLTMLRLLAEQVFNKGVTPKDWEESFVSAMWLNLLFMPPTTTTLEAYRFALVCPLSRCVAQSFCLTKLEMQKCLSNGHLSTGELAHLVFWCPEIQGQCHTSGSRSLQGQCHTSVSRSNFRISGQFCVLCNFVGTSVFYGHISSFCIYCIYNKNTWIITYF